MQYVYVEFVKKLHSTKIVMCLDILCAKHDNKFNGSSIKV